MRSCRPGIATLLVIASACVALAAPSVAAASFPGANGQIAFERYPDMWVVNQDGSGEHVLKLGAGQPAWSPDGRKLAYSGNQGIRIMNADGSGDAGVVLNSYHPAWSPDGTRLAYVSYYDIWVVKADGTNPTRLTFNVDIPNCEPDDPEVQPCPEAAHPAWSPDGTKIAFEYTEHTRHFGAGDFFLPGAPEIRIMNTDGSGATTLTGDTPEGVGAGEPNWSPDGSTIAFLHYECWCSNNSRYPDYDAIINADGSGEHRIPNTDDPGSGPAWSPDGQWIVHHGYQGLAKIKPDGTGKTALTPSLDDRSPDWQPIQNLGRNPYPRPGGATPLRVALVPAYTQCTTASRNSNHVAPLALDSCAPPVQESALLTVSTDGEGFARLTVLPGLIGTPADEADVRIEVAASDVRNASDGSDYSGKLRLSLATRITDQRSGFGGVPATVSDTSLSVPLDCVANPTAVGADCSVVTTADALLPSLILERKRTILSIRSLTIQDLGADGEVNAGGCPLSCGTGDERAFLEQGVYTP